MVQPPDDDADPREETSASPAPASGPAPDPSRDGSPEEFAARWAAIVAELGEPESLAWPYDRDAEDDEHAPRGGGHVVREADEWEPSGRDWDGTAQFDAAEQAVDDEEHFVPPDPGPVLGNDPLRILTWSVAVGVPVLYLVLLVAWHDPPGWLAPVAGVLLLAAIGVLVWRMPRGRDHDDDSGAVV